MNFGGKFEAWVSFHRYLAVLKISRKSGANSCSTPLVSSINLLTGVVRGLFWSFFKIAPCSAISLKRSRRDLSIDVAEHRSTFENKGVMRILVKFQDRPMFSHIIEKISARAFH